MADNICIRNCFDWDIAFRVLEGLRILNVTMGIGVSVSVVNEERVIPLNCGGALRSGDAAAEVATTTEWGNFRISWRRWEDNAGSSCEAGFDGSSLRVVEECCIAWALVIKARFETGALVRRFTN